MFWTSPYFSYGVSVTGWLLVFALLLQLAPSAEGCSGNTCSQCITSGEGCAWCADVNFTGIVGDRCGLTTTLITKGCDDVHNPPTQEVPSKRTDKTVTDGDNQEGIDAIQLQPQKTYVKVRPHGNGFTLNVTFRPANNFPVDLYFLFDLSSTMKKYITDFGKLANEIAGTIGNISKNFRMGFGTFQDKVILPFTNTHPAILKNPCPNCSESFNFRNELELTKNLTTFKNTVDSVRITGNIDTPEGGFDAMMQVIACGEIGWRENSRQIIIFASDARMHFAGDGKLAGLIEPNDGQCHLVNKTNQMSEKQDYPSLGQISFALDKSKKHVVFAVVQAVYNEYLKVGNRVPRSTVRELKLSDAASTSILDIVRDKYREMTAGVSLESKTTSDNVKVTITPKCPYQDKDRCVQLNIGEAVNFDVNVRVDKCPADPKDRLQTVTVSPSDFLKDTLNITVEVICDCDCQQSQNISQPAEQCSRGNGTLVCGICSCRPDRSGSTCQCSKQDVGDFSVTDNNCFKSGNITLAPECSGSGECVCGVCQCQSRRSGQFCQCNDAACPANKDGLVCSGNGECRCEHCLCKQNYTGLACECTLANDYCVAASLTGTETEAEEGKVCSGHGKCHCGRCFCDEGYVGRHCQTCYQCGNSICDVDNFHDCAICHVQGTKCPDECPAVEIVPEVQIEEDSYGSCRGWRTDECHVRFVVRNPGVNATILVQQAQVCTQGPDIVVIVLGVVGGVVGVGLILLILVKLLTSLFDRLEYQHFIKELQSPKWAKQNNPIYKEATTTYHNPVMKRD